jgi:hypothetical protein
MDWSILYPSFFTRAKSDGATSPVKSVEFADIGCGYGGLLGKFQNYKLITYYLFTYGGMKAVACSSSSIVVKALCYNPEGHGFDTR